jgi:hypothetical protein
MEGGKRSGDDDTSKDRVVIQRVIHKVGGRSSYPALTKTNYSDWTLLMKVKLKARALWSVIEDGSAIQQEKMMPMIAKKETTKEAWDAITTMRVGDDRMKKAMAQQLRQKFDLTMFDDGETVEDYALRLSGMVAHLTMLGKEVKDDEIPADSLQADHDRNQDITQCVDYVYCKSDRAVEGGVGVRGSTTIVAAGGKLYLTEEEWDT